MNPARRQLLASMSAFTCAALGTQMPLGKSLLAAPFPAANRELYGKAVITKMRWFNEPASARQSGDQLVVTRDYSDCFTVAASEQRTRGGGASSAKALRSKFFILPTARALSPLASAAFHAMRPWMRASCAALPKVRASKLFGLTQ